MTRRINVPIFIPHLGCPNDCVFCNQRTISGQQMFDVANVESELDRALSTIPEDADVEIAFFGGSFTGIERALMVELLEIAARRIAHGKADSIRLSTRPDYISGEILTILKQFPVKTIELGLQSFSDAVLTASKRGHTSKQSEAACRQIVNYGFDLVGQMMLGLPHSTREDEIHTARKIVELGCKAARIYPTAVLCRTELAHMAEVGLYTPLTIDEATHRAADVLEVFIDANVKVIRLGLCASELLFDEIAAGEYHAAIGELAQSEVYMRRIRRKLSEVGDVSGREVTIFVPKGEVSKVIGQKRKNKLLTISEYNVKRLAVLEMDGLCEYNINIEVK